MLTPGFLDTSGAASWRIVYVGCQVLPGVIAFVWEDTFGPQ